MQNRRATISLHVAAPFAGTGIADLIANVRHLPGVRRVQAGASVARVVSIDFDREVTGAGAIEEHIRRRWRRVYRIGVRPIEDLRIPTFAAPRRETAAAREFAATIQPPSPMVGAWDRA